MKALFSKFIKIICLFWAVNVILAQQAYAYLDPGTGSMVLQIIISFIVGVGCTFKIWKDKVVSLFVKNGDKNGDKNDKFDRR